MSAGPDAPVARRWWSPAPVTDPGTPISASRAYAEVLGVYLAFFGASIIVAAGTQASFNLTNPEGWWITASSGFDEVAQAGLALTVVLLLSGRRGRRAPDVGLVGRQAKGGPGLRQGIRMAAWAAGAFLVGGLVTSALATGNFPFAHTEAANTVLDLSAALNAGIVEETVVLAFLVTTLEQARRPRLEIIAVALVLRGAYHIYYGPGAVGILVWASVFLWLFWRFRSVVPLIITHICWDSMVFLGRVSSVFSGLLVLLILGLLITATVLWLVDRSDPAGPGRWQPDRAAWPPPVWGAQRSPVHMPGLGAPGPTPWGGPPGGSQTPWSGPPGGAQASWGTPAGGAQGSWGAPPGRGDDRASGVRPPPPAPPEGRDGWGPPAGR